MKVAHPASFSPVLLCHFRNKIHLGHSMGKTTGITTEALSSKASGSVPENIHQLQQAEFATKWKTSIWPVAFDLKAKLGA